MLCTSKTVALCDLSGGKAIDPRCARRFTDIVRTASRLGFVIGIAVELIEQIDQALNARRNPIAGQRDRRGHGDHQHHAAEIGRATSELQSLMRISYAVFCLKKKIKEQTYHSTYLNMYTRKQ